MGTLPWRQRGRFPWRLSWVCASREQSRVLSNQRLGGNRQSLPSSSQWGYVMAWRQAWELASLRLASQTLTLKKEMPWRLGFQASVMSSKNTLGGEALGQREESASRSTARRGRWLSLYWPQKPKHFSPGAGIWALVHNEAQHQTVLALQITFRWWGSLRKTLSKRPFPPSLFSCNESRSISFIMFAAAPGKSDHFHMRFSFR
jgi:hypothetical protein